MIYNIVVLGAGESGTGAAILAQSKGFNVLVSDNSKISDKYKAELNSYNIKWEEGNECDLNDIYTGNITNMTSLFKDSDFNGDISKWDVSNVERMENMICGSPLEGIEPDWYKD